MSAMCHRRLGLAALRCAVSTAKAQNHAATQSTHRTAQFDVTAAPPSTASGSR
ncbi:molybdopterin biosynthesis protein [Xanthomonas bromi]|uniref:Molybdopterin biosynthesis protein n=1 Tax=Xanthomonas bromi TaxID=56449 RepID=A0ABX5BTK9_9XANT|nr:molybdopterin biosynthesis protein [Xanthomonas bromi]